VLGCVGEDIGGLLELGLVGAMVASIATGAYAVDDATVLIGKAEVLLENDHGFAGGGHCASFTTREIK
jgi:hypothetical protein